MTRIIYKKRFVTFIFIFVRAVTFCQDSLEDTWVGGGAGGDSSSTALILPNTKVREGKAFTRESHNTTFKSGNKNYRRGPLQMSTNALPRHIESRSERKGEGKREGVCG
jgi:hypothetical protein